jgi:hypothetical protein
VFTDAIGRPLRPETVSRSFGRSLGTVGVPRIRFHDLRHSAATTLLAAGVPLAVISEWLGHAGIAITAAAYAAVVPELRHGGRCGDGSRPGRCVVSGEDVKAKAEPAAGTGAAGWPKAKRGPVIVEGPDDAATVLQIQPGDALPKGSRSGPRPMVSREEVERTRRELLDDRWPAGERSIAKVLGVSRDAVRYALGKDRRRTLPTR